MKQEDISKFLRSRLGSLSGLPQIADENESFTPNVNAPYLREVCLFGQTFNIGLSSGERQDGLYQIDVLVPKNTYRVNALKYVDILIDGFKMQPIAFSGGGVNLNLEGASVSPSRIDGDFFVYSVSARWTALA